MHDGASEAMSIFAEAKAAISKDFIEREFSCPSAVWSGDHDYQTVSPLRPDANSGSFSISLPRKCFFDRATGQGGDIIELIAERDKITPYEAACYVLGRTPEPKAPSYTRNSRASPDTKPVASESEEEDSEEEPQEGIKLSWLPIPDGETPPFRAPPSDLTLYHVDGAPAYYVARYEAPPGGKKVIYPIHWTGAKFKTGMPDDLKKRRVFVKFDPSKTVVIVEGEKKRREAEKAFPEYAWTCWHGGSGAVRHIDPSLLEGCDIIVWPDFDEPGALAADTLCARISPLAGRLRRLVPPGGKPKAWDVADAIKDGTDVLALLEGAPLLESEAAGEEVQTIAEPRLARRRPYTDLGNAERFVDMWGHILRYNVDRGRWLVWDGVKWRDNDQTLISAMVKRTVRSIAATEEGTDAYAWSVKSEAARSVNALLSLARNEPGVPISETQLDYEPYYLCCPNGVVDLATGELMKARPDWLCYKITNTKYNPRATCPAFMRFLNETFQDDSGLINFVQRWVGYSLTSDVSAQLFTVFYGLGANGKSTLVETIQKVAGDYVKTAPPDTFIQKQAGGVPNDIAALRGARMVLTTETEANAKLAEAKVKSMTGGDRVSARWMRGEYFEFSPTWKITISTNHRPRISGGDYGIWRRIVLVPFGNIIPIAKQNPKLMEELWAESEGILAWAIAGAVAWKKSGGGRAGLQVPARVFEETQEYREDEDVIGRFISIACYSGDEIQRLISTGRLLKPHTPCAHVFYSFRAWAEAEGEQNYVKISQNAFGRAMRERGFLAERLATGRFYPNVVPKEQFLCRGESGRHVEEEY